MGTIAMLDILACDPKELCLTGLDFNTSRGETMAAVNIPQAQNYQEYIPGYVTKGLKDRMDLLRDRGIRDSHKHENDASLMKKLLDEGRITMPQYVVDKLNLLLSLAADGNGRRS